MKVLLGTVVISLMVVINCQDPTAEQLSCIQGSIRNLLDTGPFDLPITPCGLDADELYDDIVSDISEIVDFFK